MSTATRMVYQTEDTRNLILARAEEVFVERGFFDAQMKDIADAVGMSRHTLYRYYQNKIDLGMAIASKIMVAQSNLMSERIHLLLGEPERSGFERLCEFLLVDILHLMDGDDGRFLAEFDAYFSNHRAPEDFSERINDPALGQPIDGIRELLQVGQEDGSLRMDVTEAQLLQIMTGVRAIQKEVLLRGELLWSVNVGEIDKLPYHLAKMLVSGLSNQLSS